MEIRGHQKSSFIDYPNKIATVFFTGGCNFRCGYCHNSTLVRNEDEVINEEYIFQYLEKRKKLIDAVCISGGEATLHSGLYDFIKQVKAMGYLVKLDTNGTNSAMVKKLLDEGLLDYIAMDIKASFSKYSDVVKTRTDINEIKESIELIKNSQIAYEFRTTICKELLEPEDILNIARELEGSNRYVLQNFRDGDTVLEGKNKFTPYDKKELLELEKEMKKYFKDFKIRF